MKIYYAYIRVSTMKQGEHGVSLQEQKDAILRYCQRNSLEITEWFEERETAAKRGRPVFGRMLELLKKGKAHGVVVHKIDRSARNLKDWSELGELIDKGVEIHFVNESLDLQSRGGRLSADIQAVVAADYIRNLREETKKGFYGRLKQGFYPLPAPLGYLNAGKAKPKTIDPATAPLVRKAFELYASGQYSIDTLIVELYRRGLRNSRGGKLSRSGTASLLRNTFYIGLIRIRRSVEAFAGVHEPLINKSLYDRVQRILDGKIKAKAQYHQYLFRQMLTCKNCGYLLTGERQKGHEYYRCHTRNCATKCVRRETVEEQITKTFRALTFDTDEKNYLNRRLSDLKINWKSSRDSEIELLILRMNRLKGRLAKLTDAFVDSLIEKEIYEERKTAIFMEIKDLEERLSIMEADDRSVPEMVAEFFELSESLYLGYKNGIPDEKRRLVKIATSNREVDRKYVDIELSLPFREVANRHVVRSGGPYRYSLRTLDKLVDNLMDWFSKNPTGFKKPEELERRAA